MSRDGQPLILGDRLFSQGDQDQFAQLSGDYNEIHMDADAARRSLAGRPILHGMHAVLWAMEMAAEARPGAGFDQVRASFRKPIFLDERIVLELSDEVDARQRLSLVVDDAALVSIDVAYVPGPVRLPDQRVPLILSTEPAELTLADIADKVGTLRIPADDGLIQTTFPALASAMGSSYIAQLLAVSRLVGMVCPGRYSMLSSIDVRTEREGISDELHWKVTRADQRVRAVRISLFGGLIGGVVDAFLRPEPVTQPTFAEASDAVVEGEFANQEALVVGGSRGLGELTAKLIAAGGGRPVITFKTGSDDARRIVSEIEHGGGRASSIGLDVTDPGPAIRELIDRGWAPTHVYFFPSPKIFARRTRFFDKQLLDRFVDVYVLGLMSLAEALRDLHSDRLALFYPSTVAVDEPIESLSEYSVAKAAGEQAALVLAQMNKWLDVLIERLPRLPTDQTASILAVDAGDPVSTMLAVTRRMSSMGD